VIILLDAGPLGMLANPSGDAETGRCWTWLRIQLGVGMRVGVPEIADYEVRRELLPAHKSSSIARLDDVLATTTLLAIDTWAMQRAAQLWAEARNLGLPTAEDASLDGDVILAAQAQILAEHTGDRVVVATANVRHLRQFVDARRWQEIAP
jgi:hypothetical protein